MLVLKSARLAVNVDGKWINKESIENMCDEEKRGVKMGANLSLNI
jgi:hypothetical protein